MSGAADPMGRSKRRVAYFYDSEIGNYHYGQGHPMKPHRVRMTHNLVVNYGLYRQMEVFRPKPVSAAEMTRFHADDYINFLRIITQDNMTEYTQQTKRFNVGEDCPVFDGLFEFCQLYTSGSIGGATRLVKGQSDIVINWSGGLHHAKKSEASGFCYINDCVLAILELLKTYQRVLYIDIDIHHGDGVEEAFYTTNRVMTVSFHKFGEYFPGTGDVKDAGYGPGKGYAVNFPLQDGMNDESYWSVFKPVIDAVMERFDPEAVVLQCGADSLSGDRLGCFNLSLKGHGRCVEHMRTFNKPMLVLGGGGYTLRNVPRCWAYETSIVVGTDLNDQLPFNDYFEYYGPDYRLHMPTSNMENMNTDAALFRVRDMLLMQLHEIEAVPGVQIQTGMEERTPAPLQLEDHAEENHDPDRRYIPEKREHPVEFAGGPSGAGRVNRPVSAPAAVVASGGGASSGGGGGGSSAASGAGGSSGGGGGGSNIDEAAALAAAAASAAKASDRSNGGPAPVPAPAALLRPLKMETPVVVSAPTAPAAEAAIKPDKPMVPISAGAGGSSDGGASGSSVPAAGTVASLPADKGGIAPMGEE